jgi:hypothetical protein
MATNQTMQNRSNVFRQAKVYHRHGELARKIPAAAPFIPRHSRLVRTYRPYSPESRPCPFQANLSGKVFEL